MSPGEPDAPLSLDEIRRFWTEQALDHGQSPSASWSDHRAIQLEIAAIGAHLESGNEVLDVGCANGFSSVQYAARRDVHVLGVDYVEEMIASAQKRRAALDDDARARIEFRVGDVTRLDLPDAAFDRVVSTRVIINLATWDEQLRGLWECARVLRPNGLLLLSEATIQGWHRLNDLRREWGLEEIPMPSFNAYLDEDRVVEALAPALELARIEDFASSYYVVTRVLKPLLARASDAPIDVADPASELNRWASLLPPAGDYGTQKLFVFHKRAP